MYRSILICFLIFLMSFALASLSKLLLREGASGGKDTPTDSISPITHRLSERVMPSSELSKRLEVLLNHESPSSENKEALEAILSEMVDENSSHLTALFRQGKLPRSQAQYLRDAVIQQVGDNPSYIASLPREIDNWVGEEMWNVALRELSKSDPQLALKHFKEMGTLDESIRDEIYLTWQEEEPEAAWNAHWEAPHSRQNWKNAHEPAKLFKNWVHLQPDVAYQWIQDTPMPDHIKRDFVKDMFEILQPGESVLLGDKLEALNTLAIGLGLPSQEASIPVLKMAIEDPEAAFEMAAEIPQLDQHERVLMRIMDSMSLTDPEGALEYALAIGSSRVREHVIAEYGKRLGIENPNEGLQWAREIKIPDDE